MKYFYKLLIASVVFSIYLLIASPATHNANAAITCPPCKSIAGSEAIPCKPCPSKEEACAKCTPISTTNDCKKCACDSCCDYSKCPVPPTCGSSCTKNSDCDGAVAGCTICSAIGKCTDGNTCGTLCTDNIDCVGGIGGSCAYCNTSATPSVCTEDVPHCGKTCTSSGSCAGAKDGCSTCDPTLHKCTTGNMCGKTCANAGDCNGAKDGCSTCDPTLNKCTDGNMCGKTCANAGDCNGAKDGCSTCDLTLNKCTDGNVCGKSCDKSSDCNGGGKDGCSYCDTGTVPSLCTKGDCGIACVDDGDCAGAQGGCTVCDPATSKCSVGPKCGKPCTSYAACAGATDGCTTCDPATNKCSGGDFCGKTCANAGDCAGAKDGCTTCDSATNTCTDGKKCGKTCADNAACAGATDGCLTCDPNTNKCFDGGRCGASCTADASCAGAVDGCSLCDVNGTKTCKECKSWLTRVENKIVTHPTTTIESGQAVLDALCGGNCKLAGHLLSQPWLRCGPKCTGQSYAGWYYTGNPAHTGGNSCEGDKTKKGAGWACIYQSKDDRDLPDSSDCRKVYQYTHYLSEQPVMYLDSDCRIASNVEDNCIKPSQVRIIIGSPVSLVWENMDDLKFTVSNFALDPKAKGKWYIWKASAKTPLIVYDPKKTGKIKSAEQLFGLHTFGKTWKNGFEALASLDKNNDGKLSGDELKDLSLWFDNNQDGSVNKGEVVDISEAGVTELYYKTDGDDVRTAGIVASKGYTRTDESGASITGAAIDWFSMQYDSKKEAQAALDLSVQSFDNTDKTKSASAEGFDGIWAWQNIDHAPAKGDTVAINYLTLKSNGNKIEGVATFISALEPNSQNKKAVIESFKVSGKSSKTDSGVAQAQLALNSNNGQLTNVTVELSPDGNMLRGISRTNVVDGKNSRTVHFTWTAVRAQELK